MHVDTGYIRELAKGEKPGTREIPLSREQQIALQALPANKRVAELKRQLKALASMHPAARPEGLTEEDWRAQRNALKRLRRERRAKS
jgi:hypothetical protein